MSYDAARRAVVLFGGTTGTESGETWEWDGVAWTLRSSLGVSPRVDHALAYDSARGETVLFGGFDKSGSRRGDTWAWRSSSSDCDANGVPDECGSASADCNTNGTPDACEDGAPATPTILWAQSWKLHGGAIGRDKIAIDPLGKVGDMNVTSEPRIGGIEELRIAFDPPAALPALTEVSLESQAGGCPPGSEAAYAPFEAGYVAVVEGVELVLTFTPGLPNARTYRLSFGPEGGCVARPTLEIRGHLGDVDSSGRVHAPDRSWVVAAWTSTANYSPETDIDLNGRTHAPDRSHVVAVWTSPVQCAP
jgi:hypothetical protein